jgi:hypothetical protein
MSNEAARNSIATEIERAKTAWTEYTLLVEYPNRDPINLATQTNPFLKVDIVFMDGEQLDLGDRPLTRNWGQIILAAGGKFGTGQVPLLKLLRHFRPYLQLRDNLGSVRTAVAKPQNARTHLGWHYEIESISFWLDEVSPAVP